MLVSSAARTNFPDQGDPWLPGFDAGRARFFSVVLGGQEWFRVLRYDLQNCLAKQRDVQYGQGRALLLRVRVLGVWMRGILLRIRDYRLPMW